MGAGVLSYNQHLTISIHYTKNPTGVFTLRISIQEIRRQNQTTQSYGSVTTKVETRHSAKSHTYKQEKCMEQENSKDKAPQFAAAKLIDQLNYALEEGESEAQIHEIAWQLVDATKPK